MAGLPFTPDLISRALAVEPAQRSGSLQDVEHIVVFMQENRSFDHYLGCLNGIRGLGDPRPLVLPGGATVWAQPSDEHADGHVLPYHGDSRVSRSFLADGSAQGHQDNLTIVNGGRYNRWGASRELANRMLHYGPADLPFYYALADAFTVCDAYHCATLTQTYPNRLHLFSGCNGGGNVGGDPMMSNYGESDTPSADMATDIPLRPGAYAWTTYAERLQAAGIDWKVYQEYDNFGDNLLSVFPTFRPCEKDSEWYRRGRSWVSEDKTGGDRTRSDGEQLVAAFRKDIAEGRLPQVSWIVTSYALSEHPRARPAHGEHIAAQLIAALVDHPAVFARTAFILTYDEGGGFYDHMLPPLAPVGALRGHSTVSLDGECKDYGDDASLPNRGRQPLGLGVRVPTIIVSPWTRGGYVCSQVFDHTSVIRLMEQRFGVVEPNISAWRRSVCGDLGSAFDFSAAKAPVAAGLLPSTADFMARIQASDQGRANEIPAQQGPGKQMPGQRGLRPLPYRIDVLPQIDFDGRLQIVMRNRGDVGAVLSVHDALADRSPWFYTVGAQTDHVADDWQHDGTAGTAYDFWVRGPNAMLCRFSGAAQIDQGRPLPVEVQLLAVPEQAAVELLLINRGLTAQTVETSMAVDYVADGERRRRFTIEPGQVLRDRRSVKGSDLWFDLSVRASADDRFLRRFAGHLETGTAGRTDPAIGPMRL